METLISDTKGTSTDDGREPPAADAPNPGTDEAPAPERSCEMCGRAMTADQDWCLECGTARPGRLGGRPGWRAAASVAGITLLLLCGAVAASYAALTDDTGKQAGKPSAGAAVPVAQTPPVVAAPTGASGATGPSGTASTPTTSTKIPKTKTPKIPSLPSIPQTSTPPASSPAGSTSPGTSTGTTSTQTTATNTTTTSTTTTTTTTTTPATPTTFTPLSLDASAGSVYDPYSRATAKTDPGAAITGTSGDAFTVSTPPDGKPMQVGLLVNLGARKNITKITFATATPGFRLEVYGSDGSALPTDILDTRWTHLASKSKVTKTQSVNIPVDDGTQMRQVVLWFTTPPVATAATVKLGDVKVYTS